MKLMNKRTGEIVVFGEGVVDLRQIGCKNVAEMIEAGWEDYEEPKGVWFIDCDGNVVESELVAGKIISLEKQAIGNYFETKEEAEKAVEKLKAWQRLKDKGFKFDGWYGGSRIIQFRITSLDEDGDCLPHFVDNDTANDLDLLFSQEDD